MTNTFGMLSISSSVYHIRNMYKEEHDMLMNDLHQENSMYYIRYYDKNCKSYETGTMSAEDAIQSVMYFNQDTTISSFQIIPSDE